MTENHALRETRRRTGGRSARIRAQIFRAVLEELVANGPAALAMPAIAVRAGVHVTTLYRRWPDPRALALEAIRDRSEIEVAVPDSGAFADDLRAFLRGLDSYIRSPLGRALLALHLTAPDDASPFRTTFWDDRFAKAGAMVTRALARGELPSGIAPRPFLEFAIAPVYLYAAVLRETFDGDRLETHVKRTIALASEFVAPAPRR